MHCSMKSIESQYVNREIVCFRVGLGKENSCTGVDNSESSSEKCIKIQNLGYEDVWKYKFVL